MYKNEDGKKERREDVAIKEQRGEEVDKGKRKWRKMGGTEKADEGRWFFEIF